MSDKKPIVTIKGTKDGLSLHIDDHCSFEEAMKELDRKLSSNYIEEDQPLISVNIHVGNRYVTDEQADRLRDLVRGHHKLVIHSIESNVITKDEAHEWHKDREVTPVIKVVRSGQVMEVEGDLLLVGDVNRGGRVVATGNIYVMGNLRGIAHAGVNGNRSAIIAASYMKPSQLRIADYISRAPDYDEEPEGDYMECGYVDLHQEKILIDRLQLLSQKRPDLKGLERRILNG
ncbi:septation inhibitor protein [Pontibacillus halophilus JSM 076056 = DSM 19796]|uniref:Probable septum site-determining protein MinC n=1 Tax=Pontibacillus halophilus JSM 076056 = DSM 19796 TaxID=1385510 RepID=A0A0A5GNE6_9BACI|nr:septum site-determining protein MinC [Pontibacillus halophilus]KGX93484.1 septation inhibitor protein [Pontibacillus halophilus JSM 076056 = DSM 19796]